MARIRTIKPEFWTDEKIVALSFPARLFFMGMLNFVDDEGRASYSPSRLKMQILPADTVDVSALLGEIRGESLIVVYEVDGKEFFQVNGFSKHQKVDKRTLSKIPAPPNSSESPRNVQTDQGREGIKDQGTITVADAPDLKTCFERFCKAYPKRKGADPIATAESKFKLAVKNGEDPEAIIAAACRYAAEVEPNTPYVAQKETWLNQKRWKDYPPPIRDIAAEIEGFVLRSGKENYYAWLKTGEKIYDGKIVKTEWPEGHEKYLPISDAEKETV